MAASGQCRTIFISYRRDDAEGEAGRLYDDLVRAYGEDSVFMDVSGIEPGLDFRKAIDDNVANCGVLLAVIGLTWATVTGRDGSRRLDNPDDYVRLEIGSALKRGVPVIPVLVHGAHMPALEQLPEGITDLRYRNSVELTHARWNSDVALLVTALKPYVASAHSAGTETVHATVPVQLPAPQLNPPAKEKKRSALLPLGIILVLLLLAAGGVLAWMHFKGVPPDQAAGQTQSPNDQTGAGQASTGQSGTGPSGKDQAGKDQAGKDQAGKDQASKDQAVEGTAASAATASQPAIKPPVRPTTTRPASQPDFSAFLGDWKNVNDPSGDSDALVQLSIIDFGGQLIVRPRGQCPNKICAWGPKNATIQGADAVTETWTLHNTEKETKLQRKATISLRPAGSGLNVTVHNTWRDPNGDGKQSYVTLQFAKADK